VTRARRRPRRRSFTCSPRAAPPIAASCGLVTIRSLADAAVAAGRERRRTSRSCRRRQLALHTQIATADPVCSGFPFERRHRGRVGVHSPPSTPGRTHRALAGWTSEDRYFVLRRVGSFEELPLAEPSGIDVTASSPKSRGPSTAGSLYRHHQSIERISGDGTHPPFSMATVGYGIPATPSFVPPLRLDRASGSMRRTRAGRRRKGGFVALGRQGSQQATWIKTHRVRRIPRSTTNTHRLPDSPPRRSGGGILIGRAVTDGQTLRGRGAFMRGVVNAMRILEASNGANQKTKWARQTTKLGHALYAMMYFTMFARG